MDLCLSTVSIAMKHGADDAAALLEHAHELGIACVDTSGAYGDAEKIVGEYIFSSGKKPFEVIIKIRPGALLNVSPAEYYDAMKQHAASSLNNLKIRSADVCMFHNAEYIDNPEALRALARIKEEQLAKKIGIAITFPSEFAKADATPEYDIISIPYNILDTRLDGMLKHTNKEIHARGGFLNGMLMADADDIPPKLADIKPYLMRIDQFCEYHGVSRLSAVLGFIKTQPKIDRFIFSAENIPQLEEIAQNFYEDYNETALRELVEEFPNVAERVIMPNLWQGEYK